MVIGFWSENSGISGTTSNMIATGVMTSIISKQKVILAQLGNDLIKLEYAFSKPDNDCFIREDYGYYNKYGICDLLESINNNTYNSMNFYDNLRQVNYSNLYFIPGYDNKSEEMLQRFIESSGAKLIDEFKRREDLVFIDLPWDILKYDCHIVNNLDLLVINISQHNINSTKKILENFTCKTVFLVGKYDDNSINNLQNLYRKNFKKHTLLGSVPYNIMFQDSIFNGRVIEFFAANMNSHKYEENYNFIKQLNINCRKLLNIDRMY